MRAQPSLSKAESDEGSNYGQKLIVLSLALLSIL